MTDAAVLRTLVQEASDSGTGITVASTFASAPVVLEAFGRAIGRRAFIIVDETHRVPMIDLKDDRRAIHRLVHGCGALVLGMSGTPYTYMVKEERDLEVCVGAPHGTDFFGSAVFSMTTAEAAALTPPMVVSPRYVFPIPSELSEGDTEVLEHLERCKLGNGSGIGVDDLDVASTSTSASTSTPSRTQSELDCNLGNEDEAEEDPGDRAVRNASFFAKGMTTKGCTHALAYCNDLADMHMHKHTSHNYTGAVPRVQSRGA